MKVKDLIRNLLEQPLEAEVVLSTLDNFYPANLVVEYETTGQVGIIAERTEHDDEHLKLNNREIMLLAMNEIVRSINDEDAGINSWLTLGVPDGADEEEICAMANDDKDFKYCTSLFLNIMQRKLVVASGLYFGKELGVIDKDYYKSN